MSAVQIYPPPAIPISSKSASTSTWKESYATKLAPDCDKRVYQQYAGMPAYWSKRCYSEILSESPWEQKEIESYGRTITLKRSSAFFAGQRGGTTTLNGINYTPELYTPAIFKLKRHIEDKLSRIEPFTSVLAFRLSGGEQSIGYHLWEPTGVNPQADVAFVLLGRSRHLLYRQPELKLTKRIQMHDGSLLVTDATTHGEWELKVPPVTKCKGTTILLVLQ